MQESRQKEEEREERRGEREKNDVVQLGKRRSFLSMMDNRIAFDVSDGEKIIRNPLNIGSRGKKLTAIFFNCPIIISK